MTVNDDGSLDWALDHLLRRYRDVRVGDLDSIDRAKLAAVRERLDRFPPDDWSIEPPTKRTDEKWRPPRNPSLPRIPPHFVATSIGPDGEPRPNWRGKIRCAYCPANGWPTTALLVDESKSWMRKHGANCARRPPRED